MIEFVILLGIQLKANIKDTKVRLQRAEKLISGLAAEEDQWTKNVMELDGQMEYLIGTTLLR